MIPRILHQTWKTRRIEPRLKPYVDSWSKYQQLDYRFYTDEDLQRLVAEFYPRHLALYERFDRDIERADFARYAILHRFGGIYADLDMQCLRSVEPLLASPGPILGTEPVEHLPMYRVDELLCNAILFSPAGHPLWERLMQFIAENYRHGGQVVYNTGPMALTLLRQQSPELFRDVRVAEPGLFYPLIDPKLGGKRDGGFDHVSHSCRIADAYTAHHWAHSYDTVGHWLKTTLCDARLVLRRHFREARGGRFDRRFYQKPLAPEETRRGLVAAFQQFAGTMRDSRIDTWLTYDSLLAWQSGQGVSGLADNIDLGVHYNDLYRMRTVRLDKPGYLLEVNPSHKIRCLQPWNKVDARLIDTSTGLFINVYGYHKRRDDRLADKRGGSCAQEDVYPLQPCRFEGVETMRPCGPLGVLRAQFGKTFNPGAAQLQPGAQR